MFLSLYIYPLYEIPCRVVTLWQAKRKDNTTFKKVSFLCMYIEFCIYFVCFIPLLYWTDRRRLFADCFINVPAFLIRVYCQKRDWGGMLTIDQRRLSSLEPPLISNDRINPTSPKKNTVNHSYITNNIQQLLVYSWYGYILLVGRYTIQLCKYILLHSETERAIFPWLFDSF
jgi:hypothetical protein